MFTTKTKKINGHTAAAAEVTSYYKDSNFKAAILKSYNTDVLAVNSAGWAVISGTYSRTTAQHISFYLKEYGAAVTFKDLKRAAAAGLAINLLTGSTGAPAEFTPEFKLYKYVKNVYTHIWPCLAEITVNI